MHKYTIYPVGDSCLTMTIGDGISEALNEKVIAMQRWLNCHPFTGLKDVVIAYNSISVLYDAPVVKNVYKPEKTVSGFIEKILSDAFEQSTVTEHRGSVIRIPVCYDECFAPDLDSMARLKRISMEEIVRLHTRQTYRVYMVGFLPGFPYLASVPEEIAVPRKKQPALVAAGSIGIAGMQTGIYPMESPGGWHIIGRTPVKIFNKSGSDQYMLKAGNYVQFCAITKEEFTKLMP